MRNAALSSGAPAGGFVRSRRAFRPRTDDAEAVPNAGVGRHRDEEPDPGDEAGKNSLSSGRQFILAAEGPHELSWLLNARLAGGPAGLDTCCFGSAAWKKKNSSEWRQLRCRRCWRSCSVRSCRYGGLASSRRPFLNPRQLTRLTIPIGCRPGCLCCGRCARPASLTPSWRAVYGRASSIGFSSSFA